MKAVGSIRIPVALAALLCLFLVHPLHAQTQNANTSAVTFFGGALLGHGSGFGLGAGLNVNVTPNVGFEPTLAIGRLGDNNMFSLDGSFVYNFHLEHQKFVPYVLGGVGLAQYAGDTHGSPIIGAGVRFFLDRGTQIRPELRIAGDGLSRFTIGLTKTF